MKKFFLFFLIFLVLFEAVGYFVASYTYSQGDRVGHLVKISEKGLLFKTYEGELNLGGLNTANNTVGNYLWLFSVPAGNSQIYNDLASYQGKEVKLHYKQRLYSFPWQGDTNYYVDKVDLVTP